MNLNCMQYLSIFYHSLLKKATEFDAARAGSEPAIMPVICWISWRNFTLSVIIEEE